MLGKSGPTASCNERRNSAHAVRAPTYYQRALFESPDLLSGWFRLFFDTRSKFSILDCDLHNFDETGLMIGFTRTDRRGNCKTVQPGNLRWAIAIACINGDGFEVPPFLLIKGAYHLANWYSEGGFLDSWAVKPTPNR